MHTLFPARLLALSLFGTLTCLASAQELPISAKWSNNVEAALKQAQAENKDVLMDFTGSDWCGWCQKLKTEVFDQALFVKTAPEHFVLVELDFPQNKKLPEATMTQNAQWMKKCQVQGFPTILLVDAKGRPFGQLGYASGGPAAYLKTLEDLRARRITRDAKWADAAKAQGTAKIKLLHEGLQALQNDAVMFGYYGAEIQELLALDADGAAGVKVFYAEKLKTAQAKKLFEDKVPGLLQAAEKDPEGSLKQLQALAQNKHMTSEFKQKTLFLASQVCRLEIKDMARAKSLFEQAIAADPDSDTGIKLQAGKSKIYP